MSKERIVELQRQLRIARTALEKIANFGRSPEEIAQKALDEIWPLDKKQPLQGLVGHERRGSR